MELSVLSSEVQVEKYFAPLSFEKISSILGMGQMNSQETVQGSIINDKVFSTIAFRYDDNGCWPARETVYDLCV